MAKKSAAAEFNMSEAIREILSAKPSLSSKEVADAIVAKYPTANINKNSSGVAFYTIRKKLGVGPSKRRGKRIGRKASRAIAATTTPASTGRPTVDIAMLQTTAKFLSQVGGAEAALEAIKFVQAAQVE
jgi:hypothetical protein